jgi:hypothetical protein
MEPWTGAQRAFAVKVFYKNGVNFVFAQREFRRELRDSSQSCCSISQCQKTWVRKFEATGSTLKKKGDSVKTVHPSILR